MPLPVRTALPDIEAICGYLATRPEGAGAGEIVSALGSEVVDPRKMCAVTFWGLVEEFGTLFRLTSRGRLVVQDAGARRSEALGQVVAGVPAYADVIVRAVRRDQTLIPAPDVAAHWHRHYRDESQFGILNHQIVCFFRIAEGAGLGRLLVGRKGQQTRFELADHARTFVDEARLADAAAGGARSRGATAAPAASRRGNRVFITGRRNRKVIDQLKELVTFGKFEPVVARDREAGRPFLPQLMDEMRGCDTAVIHVGADRQPADAGGRAEGDAMIGDLLIEIGAAMALYGRNFILLLQDGVELPPNLQGLCECRYSGNELNMPAMMRLLKAFNELTQPPSWRRLAISVGPDHVVPHLISFERAAAARADETVESTFE
jgi:predicted nucleotide-binding protein